MDKIRTQEKTTLTQSPLICKNISKLVKITHYKQ